MFGWIQTSQTGGQLFSDISLLKPFEPRWLLPPFSTCLISLNIKWDKWFRWPLEWQHKGDWLTQLRLDFLKLLFSAIAFFDHINLIYGTISEFCTPSSCPDMVGPGPRYISLIIRDETSYISDQIVDLFVRIVLLRCFMKIECFYRIRVSICKNVMIELTFTLGNTCGWMRRARRLDSRPRSTSTCWWPTCRRLSTTKPFSPPNMVSTMT